MLPRIFVDCHVDNSGTPFGVWACRGDCRVSVESDLVKGRRKHVIYVEHGFRITIVMFVSVVQV